jgi:hypothetical protein
MSVPAADNLRSIGRIFHHRLAEIERTEITAAADMLEAMDALPDDDPTHPDDPDVYWSGYRYAMRQVKALLHPEVQP